VLHRRAVGLCSPFRLVAVVALGARDPPIGEMRFELRFSIPSPKRFFPLLP
jgi:hypothetical protein